MIQLCSDPKKYAFTAEGNIHCVGFWVDYDVTESSSISYWDGNDFPLYYKNNIKFMPMKELVRPGTHCLEILTSFEFGNSDVIFDIKVVSI